MIFCLGSSPRYCAVTATKPSRWTLQHTCRQATSSLSMCTTLQMRASNPTANNASRPLCCLVATRTRQALASGKRCVCAGQQCVAPAFVVTRLPLLQVWLEMVPSEHIQSLRMTPSMLTLQLLVTSPSKGTPITATLMEGGTGSERAVLGVFHGTTGTTFEVTPPSPVQLWHPGAPYLYTMNVTLSAPGGDTVGTYFGMRSVSLVWV